MSIGADFERDRQLRQSAIRLETVSALVAAIDRRAEVFEVVQASADREAAQLAVASLLGISEVCAGSVLDRQIYHFTVTERARMRAKQTELRKRVGL